MSDFISFSFLNQFVTHYWRSGSLLTRRPGTSIKDNFLACYYKTSTEAKLIGCGLTVVTVRNPTLLRLATKNLAN